MKTMKHLKKEQHSIPPVPVRKLKEAWKLGHSDNLPPVSGTLQEVAGMSIQLTNHPINRWMQAVMRLGSDHTEAIALVIRLFALIGTLDDLQKEIPNVVTRGENENTQVHESAFPAAATCPLSAGDHKFDTTKFIARLVLPPGVAQ